MAYNIQNAFHRQSCFGVEVTPLGSNLTVLEGQEEGEVQALMEDAKGWLDQWFKEIRPWSLREIDVERTIWLRVYGIPSHAWKKVETVKAGIAGGIPKHHRKVTLHEYEVETANGRTITKKRKTRSTVVFESMRVEDHPRPSNIGDLFSEGSLNPYADDPYAFD